jgi:hypothetical protein
MKHGLGMAGTLTAAGLGVANPAYSPSPTSSSSPHRRRPPIDHQRRTGAVPDMPAADIDPIGLQTLCYLAQRTVSVVSRAVVADIPYRTQPQPTNIDV